MNPEEKWLDRIALIAALVDKAPDQTLGRTAIMKLAYFLQVLKKVPLGYHFQLHNYGPFDSDVLDDIAYAGVFGAVREKTVIQTKGYRYEIKPAKRCAEVQKERKNWLDGHQEAINWVIEEFGSLSASELELYSTIIFADRHKLSEKRRVTLDELAKQVRGIKPRFSHEYVLEKCRAAFDKGFLEATTNQS